MHMLRAPPAVAFVWVCRHGIGGRCFLHVEPSPPEQRANMLSGYAASGRSALHAALPAGELTPVVLACLPASPPETEFRKLIGQMGSAFSFLAIERASADLLQRRWQSAGWSSRHQRGHTAGPTDRSGAVSGLFAPTYRTRPQRPRSEGNGEFAHGASQTCR